MIPDHSEKKVATIYLKSVGCRTNQEELFTLKSQLQQAGCEFTDIVEAADIIIVNTCAVTSHTESKTRRLLQSLAAQAPQARILVTGCLVQQQPQSIAELPSVCWVVGNTYKQLIPHLLVDNPDGGIFHHCFDETVTQDTFESAGDVLLSPEKSFRTRFSVKIQEGCNFHCSYCIVPMLRGPARSWRCDRVVDLCRNAIDMGYRELILTGTHIGQFRDGNDRFLQLLKKIITINGDFRVRLSSLDPRDLTEELLELIGSHPRICNHLHVSIQHFDNQILASMGRGDTNSRETASLIRKFRNQFPYAGLGADIIVGFPGESEQHFNYLQQTVTECDFSYAHVFRFSSRPGTIAETLPDKLPESVKNERSELIRDCVAISRRHFLHRCSSISHRIIIESDKPVRGVTANYLHVQVDNGKFGHNSWLDVNVSGEENGRYCQAVPV
ncbi:MAG TPA: tRNA (N(6)-L-threonylcarbamoyladenosine(37)-C(2))-methylthiotransferase MtaB [Chitinispirillaceae bacterium]|nr:tRNA (N(6)-L-threonylcarbamoyladenosine(37)-C(2))-methylthiotransferase MtaB [Chitinispirillaceae bacterium]